MLIGSARDSFLMSAGMSPAGFPVRLLAHTPFSIMISIVMGSSLKGGLPLSVPDDEGSDKASDTIGEDACVLTEIICGMDGVSEGGVVRISNEVLAIIAGIATGEIEGVTGMAGSLVESISERFGRHDLSRGVKVETQDDEVSVDVFVNVEYGCRIPEVARSVQTNVKEAIENMTDLQVKAVNIHIQEVVFSPCGEEDDVR